MAWDGLGCDSGPLLHMVSHLPASSPGQGTRSKRVGAAVSLEVSVQSCHAVTSAMFYQISPDPRNGESDLVSGCCFAKGEHTRMGGCGHFSALLVLFLTFRDQSVNQLGHLHRRNEMHSGTDHFFLPASYCHLDPRKLTSLGHRFFPLSAAASHHSSQGQSYSATA